MDNRISSKPLLLTLDTPCQWTSDPDGWTVFQRRVSDEVEFYRGWDEYVNGFGDPSANYWMCLEGIHIYSSSCSSGHARLFIYLETFSGEAGYAHYSTFSLGDVTTNYTITVSGYSGTVGGSALPNNVQFTTFDADHDRYDSGNCAISYHGAWWYTACHGANLNGIYYTTNPTPTYAKGICWNSYKTYYESMKVSEMRMYCY